MAGDQKNLFPNPALYRELSVPFESMEEANAKLNAFLEDIGDVRKKHKIPNLHVVINGSAKAADGEEAEFITSCHFGDELRAEGMLAHSLGRQQKERQERIGKYLAQALKHPTDRG